MPIIFYLFPINSRSLKPLYYIFTTQVVHAFIHKHDKLFYAIKFYESEVQGAEVPKKKFTNLVCWTFPKIQTSQILICCLAPRHPELHTRKIL